MRFPIEIKFLQPQSAKRRKLPVTVSAKLRIAQISNANALFEGASYFSQNHLPELQKYAPHVLLGSLTSVLDVAKRTQRNDLDLQNLDRAVFILTDCRNVLLRDKDRVTLWQSFGVPVYELLLGGDGSLLASECEAYEGFHIESNVAFTTIDGALWYSKSRGRFGGTGFTGNLEVNTCPCGRVGKRLLDVAVDYRDAVRHQLSAIA